MTASEARRETNTSIEDIAQLAVVTRHKELPGELGSLLGLSAEAVLRIDPRDVSKTDWQEKRLPGKLWAVVIPEGTGTLRLDGAVHWAQALSLVLRPSRMVVVVETTRLDEILAVVRAGADGIALESDGPKAIVEDLKRAGARHRDYFPDPQNWLGSLRRASEELLLSEDPETQLVKLLRVFVSQLKVNRCSIMLLDEEGNLRIEAGMGLPDDLKIGSMITPNPNSVSAWVLANKRPRLLEGTLDATASQKGRRALSAISVPLIVRDKLLGLVNFSSFDMDRRLGQSDLAAAEVFSSLLAMAIMSHRLHVENLAAERLSTIGRTMAHVSHSIKNVLQVFNGANMIMKNGIDSGNQKNVQDGFAMVMRATRRLEGLIMDLLDYSKERPPDLKPTNVAELLEAVRATYFEPLKRDKHELEIDCKIGERLMLDDRRLQLALFNLVSNAIDVMAKGGKITMEARAGVKSVHFSVLDEGPGVNDEHLETIFEPFYSTKGSRGTGLGLAMVSKFAEECGGRVWAENRKEGGLAITIELPLLKAQEGQA